MNTRTRICWTVMVSLSFGFQLLVFALEAGYYATPLGTLDSAGNELGFNNPVTMSHIAIMFSNISLGSAVTGLLGYFLVCLLAHVVGLFVIWSSIGNRGRLIFFGAQTILFPLGWVPLFWMGPILVLGAFFSGFEGETITDGPLNMIFAHVTWWMVSLTMFLWNLGLKSRRAPVFQPSAVARTLIPE